MQPSTAFKLDVSEELRALERIKRSLYAKWEAADEQAATASVFNSAHLVEVAIQLLSDPVQSEGG